MPGDIENNKSPDTIFDEFDADKSGSIDKSELQMALAAAGVSATNEQIEKLVTLIDTDGDGKISKSEFRAFVGTSKTLSTQDVVNKMQLTLTQQLLQATTPVDFASIYLESQSTNNYGGGGGGGGAQTCQAIMGCLIALGCGGGYIGAIIYGMVIGVKYTDETHPVSKECSEAANWILILCISTLVQGFIMSPLQKKIQADDPMLTSCMGKLMKSWSQAYSVFVLSWLIYGCVVFFKDDLRADNTKCPMEVWNYGFVWSIIWLSLIGLICFCVCLQAVVAKR